MRITATKTAFDDASHRVLLEKVNPAVGVDCIAGTIQRDMNALYEVRADGLLLGIFVSRIERLIDGSKELVILHASAAEDTPLPMTRVLNRVFDQVALDNGLNSIRVHSDKRGLDRILEKNNYEFQEAVYRKAL